jgi:hypothetical protein
MRLCGKGLDLFYATPEDRTGANRGKLLKAEFGYCQREPMTFRVF